MKTLLQPHTLIPLLIAPILVAASPAYADVNDFNLSLLLGAAGVFSVAAFTPGPANAIIAAISANRGWRAALPFVLGMTAGFPAMLGIFGLGLGTIFSKSPELHFWLRIAGALFLLHIAWKIATAKSGGKEQKEEQTPGFWYAVFFQWVNPKTLVVAASLSAAYVRPEQVTLDALTLAALAVLVIFASSYSWALAGAALGRTLTTPHRMQIFNRAMGAILALSVAALFL